MKKHEKCNILINLFKLSLLFLLMRILGIDIGIKNLAYCIVEKHDENYIIPEPIHIHWNILDIVKENVCCEVEDCDNDVKKFTNINKEMRYYCGKHARKKHKELCEKYPMNKYLLQTSERCTQINSCKKVACCKMNGTFLCETHDRIVTRILAKERSLQDYKIIINKTYTSDDLKERLINALDAYRDLFLSVDHVRIETQPMFVSCKVKLISDTLASWFFIRGIIDVKLNHSLIKTSEYSDSKNKLKISENSDFIKDLIDKSSNRYSQTKKMGIEECKLMLFHSPQSLKHLTKFKKLDDLCDAYLHAVYGIQRENKKNVKNKLNPKHLLYNIPSHVILFRKISILNVQIQNIMYKWSKV